MTNLRTRLSAAIALCTAVTAVPASADNSELDKLKHRLQELEAKVAHSNGQGHDSSLVDRLQFSAVIETEASYSDSNEAWEEDSTSDLVVATVELGLEAQIDDKTSANLVFLYEEDDTDLEVDIATLHFAEFLNANIELTLGQDYLPFGQFHTALINDTLILEMAEIRETAAIINWQQGELSAAAYLFNGDVDAGDDTLDNFGLSLAMTNEQYRLGLDYISNLLDSDAVSGLIEDAALTPSEQYGAVIVNASVHLADITLSAEYLRSEEFKASKMGGGADMQPEGLQLELAMDTKIANRDYGVAVAVQETDDAAALGLPERRISLGMSTAISDKMLMAVEFWRDEDYGRNDGASGEKANSLVVQLAVEL